MTGTQSSEARGTIPRTTVACYSLLSWKHSDRLEGVVTLPSHFSRFFISFCHRTLLRQGSCEVSYKGVLVLCISVDLRCVRICFIFILLQCLGSEGYRNNETVMKPAFVDESHHGSK